MPHFSYTLTRHSKHAPELLFDRLSDAPSWPSWTRTVPSARWENPARTGPGAIRLMGAGRFAMRERVVSEERPHVHVYEMDGTFPARNYRAAVRLVPAVGGGTQITWSGAFNALPGVGHAWVTVLEKVILGRILRDLAA